MVFNLEETLLSDIFSGVYYDNEDIFRMTNKGNIAKDFNGHIDMRNGEENIFVKNAREMNERKKNGGSTNKELKKGKWYGVKTAIAAAAILFGVNIATDSVKHTNEYIKKQNINTPELVETISKIGNVEAGGDTYWQDKIDFIKKHGEIPPGIANAKDPALIFAEDLLNKSGFNPKKKRNRVNVNYAKAKYVMRFIPKAFDERGNMVTASMIQIQPETKFTSPAYHYLCAKMNESSGVKKLLYKKNKPLYHFSEGIAYYFITYVKQNGNYKSEVEYNLLASIFTAAGRPESDVKGYLNMEYNDKIKYIQGWAKDIKKKNSNEQLIVAWSSFFLTNHYNIIKKKGEHDIMFDVEVYSKKIVGFPIRGPPAYIK